MILTQEDYLIHYGVLRKSGRYPWGSGDDETQRNKSFLDHVQKLKAQGLTEVQIAEGMGLTTSQLRNYKTIARSEQKQAEIHEAQMLKDKGYSHVAIGEKMGKNESSVRALLAPGAADKNNVLAQTVGMLKDNVEEKKYVDVGRGVEAHLNISKDKLKTALAVLTDEGYKIHYYKVPQVGNPGKFTSLKILTKDDVTGSEMFKNLENVRGIQEFSTDGGRSFVPPQAPLSISSKRVAVRYAEDGGTAADGVIYVRPGVDDVSLGKARYAQVRIKVDDTHFLKGMAVYNDDLPPGVDLMFNTNKSKSSVKNDKEAMKDLKKDADLPFGAIVRPLTKRDANGKEVVTSVMNIVNEEGNWDDWSRSLSPQMLSKQSPQLAKAQLDKTYAKKVAGLEEIMSLTNPTVRKKLLQEYSDEVDSSAVHLKAASLDRQAARVILPINSIKPTEIYAPSFRDGERVVLIRYPHGGIFEIPELIVNNRNREAKKIIGLQAKDAVGIHHKVAEKLSGADFDGDTVLVIPNNESRIKTAPTLTGLKNFDAKAEYPAYPGMKPMTAKVKGQQMGNVSNLITDMTIRGANSDELAAAVRHSMVVIDAEKHNLDYKQSAINNGIPQLKQKYQSQEGTGLGASTLISRAKSEERVRARKQHVKIDPETGKKIYTETGESWVNAKGKTIYRTEKTTKLAEADDAFKLSSGTPIETLYATHSNKLKALANTARKEMVNTETLPYNPSAKAAYSKEVASLDAKLNLALRNAPRERQAQLIANSMVAAKKQANPDLEEAELKKIKSQALHTARLRSGAEKQDIHVTDSEWAAIQAGAISNDKLTRILNNADTDRIKQLAMPKTTVLMSTSKQQRAAQLLKSGYTQAEVADALGVSLSTLKTSLQEG